MSKRMRTALERSIERELTRAEDLRAVAESAFSAAKLLDSSTPIFHALRMVDR